MVNKEQSDSARKNSSTSSFGVSKREGHDASQYYSSRLYSGMQTERDVGEESPFPEDMIDRIIEADSRKMTLIPDNSVHLMVTSPPYNVTKDYDDDLSLPEYLSLLQDVFAEVWRVLVPGGRAVINIANVGRKPYIPLASHVNLIMQELGFLMRGEVIWDKSASAGSSTAWGSFQSASNPCLRDVHEYILIFSKGSFGLPRSADEKQAGRIDSIQKQEFIDLTKSIWSFPTESAKRVSHPAPFPVELPRRCIEFYTFCGDVVLDPFCGSGSTAVAAKQTARSYICFDINAEYIEIARQRVVDAPNPSE